MKLFQRKAQKNHYNEIEVEFYKKANAHVPHGQVRVTHKAFGLTQAVVNFAFPGVSEAPPLTKRLVIDLWSAGESQGYFVHELVAYGEVISESATYEPLESHEQQASEPSRKVPVMPRKQLGSMDEFRATFPDADYVSKTYIDNRPRTPITGQAPGGLFSNVAQEDIPAFLRKAVSDSPVNLATGSPADVPTVGTGPQVEGDGQIRFPRVGNGDALGALPTDAEAMYDDFWDYPTTQALKATRNNTPMSVEAYETLTKLIYQSINNNFARKVDAGVVLSLTMEVARVFLATQASKLRAAQSFLALHEASLRILKMSLERRRALEAELVDLLGDDWEKTDLPEELTVELNKAVQDALTAQRNEDHPRDDSAITGGL